MTDQRIFTRVPFIQSLKWQDMAGNDGSSNIQNVGRGGIGILSNSYLRPDPMVTLVFDDIEFENKWIELQALVTWCKPAGEKNENFQIGTSWVQGEQRTLPTINEVFYSAMHQHAVSDHFIGN